MRRQIEDHLGGDPLPPSLLPLPGLQRLDRLLQPAQVRIEPDRLHVPRLLAAQQIPRSPQLEVAQRDPVPGPEVRVVFQHPQALLRVGVHEVRDEQVAVGAAVAPADAPAQLVELCQP